MMSDKIRETIVRAASKRMAHYGYSKTSMNEIAADCEMSVGNLYRFYKNKEAIAVASAHACLCEKAVQSEVAAEGVGTAFDRLYGYLCARLGFMHKFVSETPHMHEIVELISTRHQDLLQLYEKRAVDYLAMVLKEGQFKGTVKSGDVESMAADLYRATMCFNMPMCMYGLLAEKEQQLYSLLKTIFKGLGSQKEEG